MNKITSNIRRLVAQTQRRSLGSYKVATINAATYLQQLNFQKLNKTKKPSKDEDVRAFYENLKEESLKGPIFPEPVLRKVKDILINLNKNEVQWLANILVKVLIRI